MKNSLVSFILLVLISCSQANKLIVSQKEKLNRQEVIDGKEVKVGLWIEIIGPDNIQIANYLNGLKEGKVKVLFDNGEYTIAEYSKNVLNGWKIFYRKDHVPYLEVFYKNGEEVRQKSYTPSF